jgi:hypothetical protein
MDDDNNVLLCGNDVLESENEAINTCHLSEPTASIISFEDWNELTNSKQPDISDWKDYPMNYEEVHKIDVRITFNEVTRNDWETAKEEINSILKNAKGHDLINLFENEKPTNAQILSLFFARESQFSKVLMSHLQIDYITLLRWLNDVCIQAVYQLSPEDLYNDELFLNVLLLSYTENNMI